MPKKIAILGNGPSVKNYKNNSEDIIIGINVPAFIEVVYTHICAVDAYAISHAYRKNMPWHKELNKDWLLVLGPRCASGLKQVKDQPGGNQTLLDYLEERKKIYEILNLPKLPKLEKQHYFSSGHMALHFACKEYKNSDIHLYGFDSFFTGNTYSNTHKILRNSEKIPEDKNEHTTLSREWSILWQDYIASKYNTANSINIHGFGKKPLEKIQGVNFL